MNLTLSFSWVGLVIFSLPLEVFPVLYFLCAAVWLHDPAAVVMMAVFGAAHITVSLQLFKKG